MFTFKYFKIPRTLSRDYCGKALQALEKIVPSTSSHSSPSDARPSESRTGWTKKPQKGVIHLIVVDTAQMARMNEQFRGKSGPTDILTFSYREENRKQKTENTEEFFWRKSLFSQNSKPAYRTGRLKVHSGGDFKKPGKVPTTNYQLLDTHVAGEIYLCLEKIKLYAKERGVTYREQLEYIVVHGLVHLMGYDHETEEGTREMERVEKRIRSAIS